MRIFTTLLLSLFVFMVSCSDKPVEKTNQPVEREKGKPNVLIILSDDQGWADVGFNGCEDIPTPCLDRLAAEGISFHQGYASHPYCSPSRAGLLSGRYQQRFGHENNMPYTTATNEDGLPLEEVMISEVMQENGYKTCAIGKWHLGDSAKFWPNERGFDDWYGFPGGGMSYWGDTKKGHHGVMRDGKAVSLNEITYLTDDFSNEAVKYINEYTSQGEPFFMYLAYNAPHTPNHATSEYLSQVNYIEDGNRLVYAAMVTSMDKGIGRVVDKLKETGVYDNTLIFFYSDNGGASNGARNYPYRGHKGMMFEGGIRVPFLVSWPNSIKGGSRYQEMVSALDIFPTILAATGISHPKEKTLSGVNLLPFLSGAKQGAPHDKLFWRYSDGAGYAVRLGNYKMVWSGYKEDFFLFDMQDDPYEKKDLKGEMPEKLKEMQRIYAEWDKSNIKSKWQDPHAENVLKQETQLQETIKKACRGEKKNK